MNIISIGECVIMSDHPKKKKRPRPFRLTRKQILFVCLLVVIVIGAFALLWEGFWSQFVNEIVTCRQLSVNDPCHNGFGTPYIFNDLQTPEMVTLTPP